MSADTSPSFLGRGWSFPPAFSKGIGDASLCSGIEDIRQSLHILFNTIPGERVMLPEYGCDLTPFMFQPVDASLQAALEARISRAIFLWEPRIELLEVAVRAGAGFGDVLINVDFRVYSTNTRNNLVFPFYLGEATLAGNVL